MTKGKRFLHSERKTKPRYYVLFGLTGLLLFLSTFSGLAGSTHAGMVSNASSSSQNQSSSTLYPLPKSSAPPGTIDVVGYGGTSQTIGYTLAALQGIVARTQPQIFLTHSQDDKFWLNYIQQNYGLKTQTMTETEALQHFESYVTNPSGKVKVVLFSSNDKLSPMDQNIAVTLAGVNTALPVATGDLKTIQGAFGASNIDVLYTIEGNFSSKVAGYTWLWNTVHNQVTKSFLTIYPDANVGITDYIVEFKSMIFEFTGSNAAPLTSSETSLANTITSAYAQNTPVMGFFGLGGEVPTVLYLTARQLLMQPGESIPNLSLMSGLPDDVNLKPVASPTLTYQSSKTYVLFMFSQGSALNYDYGGNLHSWNAVDKSTGKPYREEVPVTFQTNPILAVIAPPVLKYWYSSMYPTDSFTTGGSGGAGYVHPEDLPNEASFVTMSDTLDNNIGLVDQFIITMKFSASDFAPWIADGTPPQAIYCWKQNLHSIMVSGVPVITPAFWAPKNAQLSQTDVNNAISQIEKVSASGNHFIYISLQSINEGMPYVKDIANGLPSNYVVVNAVQMGQLYAQANA